MSEIRDEIEARWAFAVVGGSTDDIGNFLRGNENFPIDCPCVGPRGQTALCYTITCGLHKKTIKLLKLGAGVNEVSPWEEGACQTPLTAAIDVEEIALIGLLLQYGANPTLDRLNAWEYATKEDAKAAEATFYAHRGGAFKYLHRGPRENLNGDRVTPGCATRKHRGVKCNSFWYCGQKVREAGKCACGNCGEKCGPTNGCPCATCLRMVSPELRERLQTSSNINSEVENERRAKRPRGTQ